MLEPELAPELGVLELGVLELEALGVLVSLLELELEVAPPEAAPAFSLSFSASVVAELDELALPPTDAEPDGGVDGVDDALLLEPEAPGAVDVRSLPRSSPQAARPRAKATATANVESLMGYSKVGYEKESSKLRAGNKPLIRQGPPPAHGTLCPACGSSYLLLPEAPPDGLDGAPDGLVERFCVLSGAWLGGVVEPEEVVLPPEAALSFRSHPASSAPESANETAATNAVTFMLTSVVGVSAREQFMDQTFIKVILYTDQDGRAKFREEAVPLAEGTPQARLSALLPASAYRLRHSPVGFRSQFHCTPEPQWVFILGGEMEIGLQDGSSRLFRPGEHFFSADLLPQGATFDPKVHGHSSAQQGPHPLVTLFLKV